MRARVSVHEPCIPTFDNLTVKYTVGASFASAAACTGHVPIAVVGGDGCAVICCLSWCEDDGIIIGCGRVALVLD